VVASIKLLLQIMCDISNLITLAEFVLTPDIERIIHTEIMK